MTNRGTAYIIFNSTASAESAIAHMHEAQLHHQRYRTGELGHHRSPQEDHHLQDPGTEAHHRQDRAATEETETGSEVRLVGDTGVLRNVGMQDLPHATSTAGMQTGTGATGGDDRIAGA